MRRVLLLCLLSAITGCSSTAKTKTGGGDSLPPREFVGSPSAAEREPTPGNLAARPLGMLAGQVVDSSDERRVANASIQVIEYDGGRGRARLSVNTDRNGWFDIPGLEKGRRYQLVATVDRGGVQRVGKATAVANNVRVAIYLNETRGAGDAPASAGDGPPPAASLGTPVRPGDSLGKTLDPPPVVTADPTRVAGEKPRRDFDDAAPPPTVTVPGPGRNPDDEPRNKPPLPLPPMTPEVGTTTPLPGATPAPSAARRDRETPSTRVIPSCVKQGDRVEELALYDSHGQPWELSKQPPGKLVLLDFWRVGCRPCVAALPKLVELQARYGAKGLHVVGVLCDNGSPQQRREALQRLSARTGVTLNYPVLFSEPGDCKVRRHMEVFGFPTLVLLDESGRELWRDMGYDPQRAEDLEQKIKRLLGEGR